MITIPQAHRGTENLPLSSDNMAKHKIITQEPGMVAHDFNPRTQEAEEGGSLGLSLVWAAEHVPGQPGLHRETLS